MENLFQIALRVLLLWALMVTLQPAGLQAAEPKPAELDIDGYGLLGDFQLKRLLRTIEGKRLEQPYYSANLIEDAGLIILSQLRKDGFLHPTLRVQLTLANGEQINLLWNGSIDPPLPSSIRATKVRYRIQKGVRYYYNKLRFDGLESIKPDRARAFFLETGVIPFRGTRVYSPENLKRGVSSLTEVLQRRGFQEAKASVAQLQANEKSGSVNVLIKVEQGPQYFVQSVKVSTYVGAGTVPSSVQVIKTNHPYSRLWMEDLSTVLKATNFHRGYPDTTVTFQTVNSNAVGAKLFVDMEATVKTGPQVFVGEVQFPGAKRTKKSLLENRVPLESGELLDVLKAERGRDRLARLGIFDSVDLHYDRVDDQTRDVIYELQEAKTMSVSLLFGYGSYELLRGGVEVQRNNIWGLAHSARLRAIQSFKSSQGDFNYTIPEILGEDVDAFSHGFALRREEIDFTRQEYGGGAGVHRYFRSTAIDLTARYEYQVLNAIDLGSDFAAIGPIDPAVGAVIGELRHDRRDNPVYPRRGYRAYSTLELASPWLAGDVTYQRFDIAGSYHLPLLSGLTLNLGLRHGFITSPGDSGTEVPFNKRFFPGGADSIRGYQEGEASPRNAEGKLIGAETYLLGSVELEQALTRVFSFVVFSDNIGVARSIRQYPFDESLFSVGAGLRARTIVGPVRLEYGHNLNRRNHDPAGTIHFSLGFPF